MAQSETEVLGTILVSNLLMNVSAASLLSLLFMNIFRLSPAKEFYLFLTSLLTAIFIFIFCEAIPKIYAFNNQERFLALSFIILFLRKVFSPVIFPVAKRIDRLFTQRKVKTFPTESEMKNLIQLAEKEGILDLEEKNILLALEDMDKMSLSSIMTPRRKIVALESKMTIELAIEKVKTIPYSRIPVYKDNINNIVGILYVKDLVIEKLAPKSPAIGEGEEKKTIEKIVKKPIFLPAVQSLSLALDFLRKKESHLAIVVDEFGECCGLVTLEDILEALFGEIRDEYDLLEEEPWTIVDEKTYLVSGEIDLNTLNRLTNDAFFDVKEERLSGFIAHHLRRLPQDDDEFHYRNIYIKVLKVVERRVERVLLRIL